MSDTNEKKDLSSEESSEESSSSEEEDETGKEWTEEIEKTFLKTLSSLKSKDPKIYDSQVRFFDENSTIIVGQKSGEKAKKEQPMYLRDYERKLILEKGAVMSDEEEEDNLKRKTNESRTYVEEQKELKESFKKFLHSDVESSDDESACAGFLKVKTKTATEKKREEEEYVEWLKGQKSELTDKEAENELQPLRSYWTDPKLDEGEQFLRDYILNKRYLEPGQENQSEDELSFSEEERVLEECDEYEQQYNFRFEEPDKEFIKTYPRNIENSLRRKDEKRKRKREEKKKRREEQLLQKQREVKQLKKQKKAEMLERIKKLKEITGNPQVGFDDNDLEKDFSPDEYDRKMNELFSEEFYAGEDLDEKPVFSDDSYEYDCEDIDDEPLPEDIDETVFSNADSQYECQDDETVAEEDAGNDNAEYGSVEDPDFNMDCDYNPQQSRSSKLKKQTRSSRRKGHKKTKFAEVISKKKPVFNPADKTFQQYVDEYYGLDFEDVIGDMPCRFKYRKVTPNSFGLSIEEILAADDKDLNKWCSMQKIDTIRPDQQEKFDLKIYSRRSNDLRLKKKYLPSLFADGENNEDTSATPSQSTQSKGAPKKNKAAKSDDHQFNNKKQKSFHLKDDSTRTQPAQKNNKASSSDNQQFGKKRKRSFQPDDSNRNDKFKKRKLPHSGDAGFRHKSSETAETGLSDERLKAYGINPKKYKNKLKYGGNKR